MEKEFEVLIELSKNVQVLIPASTSFKELSRSLAISEDELDAILNKLEMHFFITQYITRNNDTFLLVLTQKGLEAAIDKEAQKKEAE